MVLKLYSAEISPCARSVLLTLEALEIKNNVEIIPVDLFTGENQKVEFATINPLCKVPVLQDGTLIICDSHAINAYLVEKYATNDNLYPKNLEKRALVDTMMFFDTGHLFAAHDALIKSILNCTVPTSLNRKLVQPLEDALKNLEKILKNRIYVAGTAELTIADFSIATTLSQCEIYYPLNPEIYPKIIKWFETIKSLTYYKKISDNALKQLQEILHKKLLSK